MPTTYLWAINTRGKIYCLASNGHQWEELSYFGIDFKRISAVQRCLWAIGGDHQLYLYILGSEVPIRYKEVTYENQRWNPKDGYSHHLFPTDRPHWSSQDGLIERPKGKIKLPTLGWQWDGDWQIEDNLEGQPLGHEGWMYAFDFPMTYVKDKKINSFVRRRKWIRYRTYVAVNKWSSIPGIHADPLLEPFIDIAVGGLDVPGGDGDTLAVWAVTVQGRVMFRYGVTYNKPEGDGWIHVRTLQEKEVNHISVGPLGLVWAVTWDGKALVRTGVTRYKITGNSWLVVEPPSTECPLLQVSVGTDVVWAISRNGSIWLRKGIRGFESGEDDESAVGNGWVEMVGELSLISVGPNDQIWALNKEDPNNLFFRMGVSAKEPGGKFWKPIQLPVFSRNTPLNQIISRSNIYLNETSLAETNTLPSCSEHASENREQFRLCVNDLPSTQNTSDNIVPELSKQNDVKINSTSDSLPINTNQSFKMKLEKSVFYVPVKDARMENSSLSSDRISIKSVHSEAGLQDSDSIDGSPKHTRSGSSSQASLAFLDDDGFLEDSLKDFMWSWISGSSCVVDPDQISNWFNSGSSHENAQINEPWRRSIVEKLGKRYEREVQPFDKYEYAVERASWTKQGKCSINIDRQWLKCRLELEQVMSDKDDGYGAFIGFYFQNNVEKIDLKNISCVMTAIHYNQTVLSIYTTECTKKNSPIYLSFTTAKEMEDWIAILNTTCCNFEGLKGTPIANSIWAISGRGDIFVHSLYSDEQMILQKMFWRQLGGHLSIVESNSSGVVWGIGYNHVPWIYTGGWGGGLFQGLATSHFGIYPMTDVRRIYIYENQRWNPLTGFTARGLPTDRYMWSDSTGHYECTKENTSVPSIHWHWISNWMIDYQKPGGVDKEGWQYAKDFPRAYHSYKGIADYVRRRRWFRKCRLNTSGPWKELESVQLIDISFQVDPISNQSGLVSTWAIDIHGNVLYRHNVSKNCPQGTSWEHVAADQGFVSISVGGNLRVWAIAKDGSAYMRNGVNENKPVGTAWFHVEPPAKGFLLRQISAGKTSVWAVDNNNQLWYRQEIMPMFPEGTCWKNICDNIRRVSVGPNDEVWAISDTINTPTGEMYGVISCRTDITADDKIGSGWQHGTGSGWSYISIRAAIPFVSPST